jgi:hypothetical protein
MFASIAGSMLTFEKIAGGTLSIELEMLGWSVCLAAVSGS